MSDVRIEVCKHCKKLYHTMSEGNVCPSCKVEQLDEFKKVKKYVWDHKGCGVEEVAEACDVSHKQILNWVREERRFFSDASKVPWPCMDCGAMISMGKYCNKCLIEFKDEISKEPTAKPKEFSMKKSGKTAYISPKKR